MECHNNTGLIQAVSLNLRWAIPHFFRSTENDTCYSSPCINHLNSIWQLYLNIRRFSPNDRWISLYLKGENLQETNNATFTFGVEDKDGQVYKSSKVQQHFTNTFDSSTVMLVKIKNFLQLSQLLDDEHKITETNSLIIFCRASWGQSLAGTVQTMPNNEGVERSFQNFRTLLLSTEINDVTLRVKNREFRANREILGAQSTVFSSMFEHDFMETRSGIVDIPDCDPDIFLDFLKFLYSGKADEITASNVVSLYKTANKYDVLELKVKCLQFMLEEMSVDTFCDFMSLALRYSHLPLLGASTKFFIDNFEKITITTQWNTFMKENLDAANELLMKAFFRGEIKNIIAFHGAYEKKPQWKRNLNGVFNGNEL